MNPSAVVDSPDLTHECGFQSQEALITHHTLPQQLHSTSVNFMSGQNTGLCSNRRRIKLIPRSSVQHVKSDDFNHHTPFSQSLLTHIQIPLDQHVYMDGVMNHWRPAGVSHDTVNAPVRLSVSQSSNPTASTTEQQQESVSAFSRPRLMSVGGKSAFTAVSPLKTASAFTPVSGPMRPDVETSNVHTAQKVVQLRPLHEATCHPVISLQHAVWCDTGVVVDDPIDDSHSPPTSIDVSSFDSFTDTTRKPRCRAASVGTMSLADWDDAIERRRSNTQTNTVQKPSSVHHRHHSSSAVEEEEWRGDAFSHAATDSPSLTSPPQRLVDLNPPTYTRPQPVMSESDVSYL